MVGRIPRRVRMERPQVRASKNTCEAVLRALVGGGVLARTSDGRYARPCRVVTARVLNMPPEGWGTRK